MGKYFGTDGFRGEANVNLTADHAFKVGRFLGWYYKELKKRAGSEEETKIVIGKDATVEAAANTLAIFVIFRTMVLKAWCTLMSTHAWSIS